MQFVHLCKKLPEMTSSEHKQKLFYLVKKLYEYDSTENFSVLVKKTSHFKVPLNRNL